MCSDILPCHKKPCTANGTVQGAGTPVTAARGIADQRQRQRMDAPPASAERLRMAAGNTPFHARVRLTQEPPALPPPPAPALGPARGSGDASAAGGQLLTPLAKRITDVLDGIQTVRLSSCVVQRPSDLWLLRISAELQFRTDLIQRVLQCHLLHALSPVVHGHATQRATFLRLIEFHAVATHIKASKCIAGRRGKEPSEGGRDAAGPAAAAANRLAGAR